MDATINALGGLLLKAIPTFILFLLLHFYLKYVFFRPLDKVLQARFDATEGARKAAQDSLDRAARKAQEYEASIRAARAGIYHEQEQFRGQLRQEQAAALREARARAERLVQEARLELGRDAEKAKALLQAESELLAARIADSLLSGRAG
jgi:F-type H+-transporting ATPase subunit b